MWWRSVLLVATFACLASCHLAEDSAGTKCTDGMHVGTNGVCVNDVMDGPSIVISAGSSCAPTPASITVAVNASFRFQNDDSADHTITGSDGMVWASALSNQASPFIGITKAGSWPYTISGCSGLGVVVVE